MPSSTLWVLSMRKMGVGDGCLETIDLYHAILPQLPTALRIKPILLTMPQMARPIFLPCLLPASFPQHVSGPLAYSGSLKSQGSFPHRDIYPCCSLSPGTPTPCSMRAGSFFRPQRGLPTTPSNGVPLILLS